VLAVHVKLTVWTGGAMPLPENAAVVGELDALLLKVADAAAVPVAPGVNVTVNVTGWLVLTVTGSVRPLMENSVALVPLNPIDETDTLAPVALSVPVWVPLVPTATFPTFTGVTLNVPVLATEDPLRLMFRVGFEALEVIATFPLKVPADCGAKVTLKEVVCPGFNVRGVFIPEIPKPVPEADACEMVALDPPVFCTVSVCV
jgi:hypothetical protein